MRLRREVAYRDRDLADEVLVDGIDIELELSGNGNDGRAIGDCSSDELQN